MSESPLPQDRPITEFDLSALIEAAARENRFLEFKSNHLLGTDGGKKKFLQSVAAFANTRGGDLILGMEEENGVAAALKPLADIDPDQCRLQVQELIRVHVRPALGGVTVECIQLSDGGHAVVVRVPKSWAGPHILNYGNDRRFYIRDDGGKRPMDYEEVRDGFLSGESTAARLRNFRMERCAAILNDETPEALGWKERVVLHLLPTDMFAYPRRLNVRDLYERGADLPPIDSSNFSRGLDLDGCYTFHKEMAGKGYGYTLISRSGAIEAVDATLMAHSKVAGIPYKTLEPALVEALKRWFSFLGVMEVSPPYALFLSFLNVKGCHMPNISFGHPIRHDHIYIPEEVIDTAPDSVPHLLFGVFNALWNACGHIQSLNYDKDGNWKHAK